MFLQLLTGLSLLEVVLGASCDREFTDSGGAISSPEYATRSSYASNQNCQYDITVPSGRVAKLTWYTFDIKGKMPSCSDDYVEIFIGCSRRSIGKYCSENSYTPHDIYSPDNCLRIKFKSDSSGSGTGFNGWYSSIYGSSYLSSSCYSYGKSMYSNSGIINSPKWPMQYSSLKDCYWKIEVGSKKSVKIAFMDFDLENSGGCDDDKVKIKGGQDYQSYDSSNTVKDSMCGSKTQFYFTTKNERVWIRFKTDSFTSGRGFVAGYVVYDSSSSSVSSSSSGSVVAGIVVTIIVLIVFSGCILVCLRRRLGMRQAAQRQAMNTQALAPPPQATVHHPPPSPQPGYGQPPPAGYAPPPPAGYAPPPQPGYAPPPQPGYAPPPYSQVVGASYPQQDKTGQYPPAPRGGAPPYPPGQAGGAPPYPPGQAGGAPPYPPGQPGGAPPYPPGQAGGAPPYPPGQAGGAPPYPPGQAGGAPPYPPGQPGGAPPYPPGQAGGAPPYPPGQPGGAPPYPPGQAGGVPYPPEQPGGAPPYPTAPPGGTAPYPSAPPGGAP